MQVFIIYLLDYTVTSTFLFLYKEVKLPKPLLYDAGCSEPTELGCADGTCMPNEYFCDGSVDCPDGSDEGWYVNMYTNGIFIVSFGIFVFTGAMLITTQTVHLHVIQLNVFYRIVFVPKMVP